MPVLDALQIASPAAFLFRGQTVPVAPGPVMPMASAPNHPLPQMPLTRELQSVLYSQAYASRFETPAALFPAPVTSGDPAFVRSLAASNAAKPRWETGWTVYAVAPNGTVSLQKGDRQRMAVPGEFITNGVPGMAPQPGSIVSVLAATSSADAQPGFFFFYSETLGDVWDDRSLVRFYFHAKSESVQALLSYLTSRLNRFQIPFRMKALVHPAMYVRTDAVVLYVARRYFAAAARVVRDMPDPVAASLRPQTPLFTRAFRDGVGLAEDPNTGESFGMHRCRFTAEAIVSAWQRGDQSTAGRFQAIAARFAQDLFDFERPHLNPGSVELLESPARVEFAYA